jgi:catechol 2,3-dioxygenase
VMVRGYPGALFVSAGGYHHHLGLNTWAGEGAPPPPPGSRGLRQFEIVVPGTDQLAAEEDRLRDAGFEPVRESDQVRAADPSGNEVTLSARSLSA